MPRNDHVTRHWHLLQRLASAWSGLTLSQRVEAIPEDLTRHPRTVRRDLAVLEAAQFFLLSERAEGQVRWRQARLGGTRPTRRIPRRETCSFPFLQAWADSSAVLKY